MKKNRVLQVLFIGFLIMGILFIAGGIVSYIEGKQFAKRSKKVTATIADIVSYYDSEDELRHHVYVDYEYEGEQYTDIMLDSYSSGMHEGNDIDLLIDPEDPYSVRTPGGYVILGAVFSGLGVIFALVGGIALVVGSVHRKKVGRLLETGRRLYATVEAIDYNKTITVNGEHPLVLKCSYYDEGTGVTYRFKSNNLWTNPEIVYPVGSTVPVYVDMDDYSKYHVDVETELNAKVVDFT